MLSVLSGGGPAIVGSGPTRSPGDAAYLTALLPGVFAPGLVGGTTSGFQYQVSVDGGSFGSSFTNIVEDLPGSYSAIFYEPLGSACKVKWSDGSGHSVIDYSPTVGSDPWSQPLPGGYSSGVAGFNLGSMLDPLFGLPRAQAGGTSTITLATSTGTDVVGQVVVIDGNTGVDQVRTITAYNTTTHVATVDHPWTTVPDGTSAYSLWPPGSSAAGAVRILPSWNMVQALEAILTYAVHSITGTATSTIVVGGGVLPAPTGGSHTTLTAHMVGDDRQSVDCVLVNP